MSIKVKSIQNIIIYTCWVLFSIQYYWGIYEPRIFYSPELILLLLLAIPLVLLKSAKLLRHGMRNTQAAKILAVCKAWIANHVDFRKFARYNAIYNLFCIVLGGILAFLLIKQHDSGEAIESTLLFKIAGISLVFCMITTCVANSCLFILKYWIQRKWKFLFVLSCMAMMLLPLTLITDKSWFPGISEWTFSITGLCAYCYLFAIVMNFLYAFIISSPRVQRFMLRLTTRYGKDSEDNNPSTRTNILEK